MAKKWSTLERIMSQSNAIRVVYSTACFVALAFIGRVFLGRSVPLGPRGPVIANTLRPETNSVTRPASPETGPLHVTLGLYIADLHDVDLKEATFSADF